MTEDTTEEKDNKPFSMRIKYVSWVEDRGLCVRGKVENCALPKAGDKVEINGLNKLPRKTFILSVQRLVQLLAPPIPTNEFAIILKDLKLEDVEVGETLTFSSF